MFCFFTTKTFFKKKNQTIFSQDSVAFSPITNLQISLDMLHTKNKMSLIWFAQADTQAFAKHLVSFPLLLELALTRG